MRPEPLPESDPRDAFLARVVSGRSFADVGGLWGTVNERVSVAHRLGARALTMIDVAPAEEPRWAAFEERRIQLNLPPVACLSSEVIRLAEGPNPPLFEVVHCSGVLYHIPEPLRLLRALHRITQEHLVLHSLVARGEYALAEGSFRVPDAACLFIPALAGSEQEAVSGHWRRLVADGAVGLTRENPTWRMNDFGPWWWLPRPSALRMLCQIAGFTVLGDAEGWDGNAMTLLLAA
ncbi:methyltransferase domain-containing protein [Methylacidimicrobium sp. B4]|uniref:methyltransferase domain-containing protein n=1 Tax=Methylacidimicrobium sp. B4 TaxID=2796139 RepID=UPI001A9000D7|nr:methyltransferase domain-containing protein [Methylacidimicrobium sp. B4]QSR84388.1 hypothetical protein MacB4_09250 [Methylacidimicrobium sp. B4]